MNICEIYFLFFDLKIAYQNKYNFKLLLLFKNKKKTIILIFLIYN